MLPSAFRHLLRAALVAPAAFAVSAGCSRQAEGERCDLEWAGPEQDCDSTDLVCVACGALQDNTVDRCCRRDGAYTDPRCRPAVNPTGDMCSAHKANEGTGGTGGSGATGGSDATGGTDTGTGGTDTGTGGTTDVPTAGMSGAGAGG